MSTSPDSDKPHITVAIVKIANPQRNILFVPSLSAHLPAGSKKMVLVIRYEVMIHIPVTMELFKSFIKLGRPMTTIVASTLVTKDTRVTTAKTPHLFGYTSFNFKTS